MWRRVERLVVDWDGRRIEIRHGLVHWPDDDTLLQTRRDESSNDSSQRHAEQAGAGSDIAEILVVDRWVARNAARLRPIVVEGELASALPRIVAGREAPRRPNSL